MSLISLDDWTIEVVEELVQRGDYETDTWDFKECLPLPNDKSGKERLRGACVAFANSGGGFFIFGIKNDRTLPVDHRIVGIDRSIDFPEKFGNYPRSCEPFIDWRFKTVFRGDCVIPAVHILRSPKAPHAFLTTHKDLRFMKRTNQGCVTMTVLEIREMMLDFEERRVRLQILFAELEQIHLETAVSMLPQTNNGFAFMGPLIETTGLDAILADVYPLLRQPAELLTTLTTLRREIRSINRLARTQVGGRPHNLSDIGLLTGQVHAHTREILRLLRPLMGAEGVLS